MGYLLSGLHLSKTMTVLEFAAGSCWFSRYLNQLQCKTICCDVSEAALEIGKKLFENNPTIGAIAEPSFIVFDGHRIALPNQSVDRIICNDGFHHVPNQKEVLAEMYRVLKDGGVAGFSEPGRRHSRSPISQYEMANFKVLENDIIIEDIHALATDCGFTDVKIKALCDVDLSLEQYQNVLKMKPFCRTYSKIKKNVRKTTANKTIFFLHKGPLVYDSRNHAGMSHSIALKNGRELVECNVGEDINFQLKITNNGNAIWLNDNIKGIGVVGIGTHLFDEEGQLINLDYTRDYIKNPVSPGEQFEQEIKINFYKPGRYELVIDLVSEQICWFETIGATPVKLMVIVNPK